jgi:replicative DNA helicase
VPAPDDLDLQQLLAKWEATQYQRHGAALAGDFMFGDAIDPTPIWGEGSQILAAEGEGTMIYGPQGRGKSTLAQQFVNARHGFGPSELLGLPVKQDDRPTLYLAMDRPRQVQRSWRRMVDRDRDWEALNHKVVVWLGPLPFKLTWDEAGMLPAWAQDEFGAGLIVVDSYKDLAPKLSDDETGNLVNRVMQKTLAAGIDWLGLHHPRKAQAQNKKPDSLDDVYGSTWLTSGLGSVIGLWSKEAGDEMVEFSHIKQPAESVSLGVVRHDHAAGRTAVIDIKMPRGTDAKAGHELKLLTELTASKRRITKAEAEAIMDVKERTARDVLQALVAQGTLDEDGTTTDKTWGLV